MLKYALMVAALACLSLLAADDENIPLEVDSPDPKLAKIVIVAGNQAGNIQHQYWAGSVCIAKMLRQTPGVHVTLVRGGWPKNPAIFDNARAIVLNLEGGEGGVIHPLTESGRMEILGKALEGGVGLATFHKAAALPPDLGQLMINWQGAFYDFKKGNKGHWTVAFNTFPDHPVTRGVKPFTLNDGYCVGLTFGPDSKGLTPILYAPKGKGKEALAAETSTDKKDITAWTFERADSGRSFGFTGLHSHRYFELESIRKLVVNGILWTAKIDIPAEGAKCDLDKSELEKNIEAVSKPPAK
ncbi:MAG TPA: thioesterase [Planctomycetota bacterium]|nr:thioesterase [Planctomycetota bacterium]